jgi:hypothetical protein
MSEIIIACRMIEKEIESARAKTNNTSDIIYLDRALHEYPDNLKEKIQESILTVSADTDYILLAYGLCGNALHDIFSPHSTIVIPRFHDCIHMMLLTEDNPTARICPDCLYYTDGWFDSDNTLLRQYESFAEKKGEKKAQRAYRLMLKNYKNVRLINTGENYSCSTINGAKRTCDLFDLELSEEKGSTIILEQLFAHKWDSNFLICPPGKPISQSEFLSGGSSTAVFPR